MGNDQDEEGFWETIDALRNSGIHIIENHMAIYRIIYESGRAFGRENLLVHEPDGPWRKSVRQNAKEYRKRHPEFRDVFVSGEWVPRRRKDAVQPDVVNGHRHKTKLVNDLDL